MDITVENYQLSIVNLYGPNLDSPLFFINLKNHLENLPGWLLECSSRLHFRYLQLETEKQYFVS